MKALKYSFAFLLLLNMSSCIENDIPYPYIEGVIQEFQVEGMQGEAVFNNQARTIELTIGEDAFIDSLPVTKLIANTEASIYPDVAACIKPNGFLISVLVRCQNFLLMPIRLLILRILLESC